MSVPSRFRLVSALILLVVPLVGMEIIIFSRKPWWDLPLASMQIWCLGALLVTVPIYLWINRGKSWAIKLAGALGVIWTVASIVISIESENFWLGCFSLFLALYWVVLLGSLSKEMSRSFFDPKIQWYQGRPKPIPMVDCQVTVQARSNRKKDDKIVGPFSVQVSRLDQDGAFVFTHPRLDAVQMRSQESGVDPASILGGLRGREKFDLEIVSKLADSRSVRKVKCSARPVRVLEDGKGVGLRFSEMTADSQKELSDFVESLRGGGYV